MFYFQAQKKAQKNLKLKSEKKKKCNRASGKPTDSKKLKTTDDEPNIKPTASPTLDDNTMFLQDFYDRKLKKSCIFVVCNWGWEGGRGRDLLGREWRDWEGRRGRDFCERKKKIKIGTRENLWTCKWELISWLRMYGWEPF